MVLRDGVARLTLDAAAAEAGLSKGGVLYHFPTRDALVAGMVGKIIEEFDRDIEGRMESGDEPGPIQPGLHPGHHGPERDRARPRGPAGCGTHRRGGRRARVARAAAGGRRPLAGPPRRRTGSTRRVATVVRLACDGLWLCDLFGLAPPSAALRAGVEVALDRLASSGS